MGASILGVPVASDFSDRHVHLSGTRATQATDFHIVKRSDLQ
jgi:hypothetical protein